MQQHIRRAVAIAAAAALSLALVVPALGASTRTYEVTIQLITGGQPLTPPLIATHAGGTGIFNVGDVASFGVKEIAENGNLAPLMEALTTDPKVSHVAAATAPLVPPGSPLSGTFSDEVTLTIDAGPGARFLSYESMLICTNDGFTGVDSLDLPDRIGQSVVKATAGYDAGTERNTERFRDIVPPCQGLTGIGDGTMHSDMSNPSLATHRVIRHHPGINGGHDLLIHPHDWTNPVAVIVVTRIG